MSWAGCAVRTTSCWWLGKASLPSRRFRSSVHCSSSRQHAAPARAQPGLQVRQQALRCPQELWRGGGQRRQLHVHVKHLGQRQPGAGLGPLAPRHVQRVHQRPRQSAAPRPRAAARAAAPRCGSRCAPACAAHGSAALSAASGQAAGHLARAPVSPRSCSRSRASATRHAWGLLGIHHRLRAAPEQAAQQPVLPAPQALRRGHFQQQRFVHLRHARGELQRAPAPGRALDPQAVTGRSSAWA
jgi:hypothetical protein